MYRLVGPLYSQSPTSECIARCVLLDFNGDLWPLSLCFVCKGEPISRPCFKELLLREIAVHSGCGKPRLEGRSQLALLRRTGFPTLCRQIHIKVQVERAADQGIGARVNTGPGSQPFGLRKTHIWPIIGQMPC